MPAIVARGLTKDFGQGRGLFALDLAVPEGRVHGFLGPNGAGKTTTIRLLLDLLRPTSGEARVLGEDPREAPPALRGRIGYVPGELALPPNATGQRYLDDSAALHGGIDEAWRAELVTLLGAQLSHKVRTLSKGNRQKLALVDALQHEPELLILDEPTDGLDPLLRDRVRRLLRRHVERGGTVFLSSHVVHEIETMCDDVSIVLGGRLRLQATIAELLAQEPTEVRCRVDDVQRAARLLGAAGVGRLKRRGEHIRFDVHGELLPVMAALAKLGARELRVSEGDLEDLFLRLYEEDAS